MSGWSRASPRRVLAFLVPVAGLVALGVALLLAGPGSAQAGDREPPWRDLAAATDELVGAEAALAAAEADLVDAEAALVRLREDQAALHGDEAVLAVELEQQVALARRLAIDAYMGGVGLVDAAALLDTPAVAEVTWRLELLEAHTETLVETSGIVAELRSSASATALALAADQDVLVRRIEAVHDEITRASLAIAEAEWVVEIARIHADADAAMARNGRTEPSEEQWAALRICESQNDYGIDTGNGYHGAYQFDLVTWRGTGGTGNPALRPPEEQDARARLLYAWRGWVPWPICGRHLPAR